MKLKTRLTIFFRSMLLQAGWNYLRFQGFGFAFTMLPFLKKLYKGKTLDIVVLRYMETFNTQPVMAGFCFGALAKAEEDVLLAPAKKTEWRVVKTFLSSSLASIGDRLFWDTLRPLSLAFGTFITYLLVRDLPDFDMVRCSWLTGIFLILAVLVSYNSVAFYIKWKGIGAGYAGSRGNTFGLLGFNWNKIIKTFRIIGLALTAALIILVFCDIFVLYSFSPQFLVFCGMILLIFVVSGFAYKYDIPNVYIYLMVCLILSVVMYII
ncbi:mannose/fructose/N-acetylgalactosamine-specific phosphotransferase system component IID [Elusimicrobium simillimum]|uniref:PTS system mannose/fructose/sorbose family transporter subunit IID n=1 Tax=Elusimicrobium simillimum TaxID=3143438 RepID=UPI003C6EBB93